MGDCMRSYKRSAETAEMEASNTRFSLSKRRKSVGSRELQDLDLTSPDIQLEKPCFLSNSEDKDITVATSLNSGVVLASEKCSRLRSGESSASRCSCNQSCDIVKDSLRFVDLEAKSFETEISTCIKINKFRETTASSELYGDLEEMESPEKKTLPSAAPKQRKTPSQAEIDEFFSVREKYEQKRFAEKYNYDIVKDMPLDGRFQWVRLKP